MTYLIAVVVLVLFAVSCVVWARQRGPELEAIDGLPMTRLQKRAWCSMGIGLSLVAAIGGLFVARGVEVYASDASMQLTVLVLSIGAVTASLLIDPFGRPRKDGSDGSDERDRRVLDRAPRAQAVLMILTLAAWLVCLTLRFRGAGGVPMVFLYVIFFSTLIAYSLGLSVGVLLGYRKMARSEEG